MNTRYGIPEYSSTCSIGIMVFRIETRSRRRRAAVACGSTSTRHTYVRIRNTSMIVFVLFCLPDRNRPMLRLRNQMPVETRVCLIDRSASSARPCWPAAAVGAGTARCSACCCCLIEHDTRVQIRRTRRNENILRYDAF